MPPKVAKPVFKTYSPFTETHWPTLSSVDRDNILDLVCSLLQPLGDHRRQYITPSKGKKRKRKSKPKQQQQRQDPDNAEIPDAPPPLPEFSSHVLVGLNSVTRHLEALAAQNAPSSITSARKIEEKENGDGSGKEKDEQANEPPPSSPAPKLSKADAKGNANPPQPLALVIIPHPNPPSSLAHAHIPTLIHLSNTRLTSFTLSSTTPTSVSSTATRLIAVPPHCESLLSNALHLPHVGALAIMEDAQGANALVQYVREHVGLTECKWIDEAMKAEWKGVSTTGV